jgi:hypothetical protein
VLAAAQGALAADQKQCADQFKAADLNNDGVIVRSEMGSSPSMMPASLNNKARIRRKEYMAACTKEAAKKIGSARPTAWHHLPCPRAIPGRGRLAKVRVLSAARPFLGAGRF